MTTNSCQIKYDYIIGYCILVNGRSIHDLFSTYVLLKMLFCCVWYFDFVCFSTTFVKNLMKK